jgi:hypothetical protein
MFTNSFSLICIETVRILSMSKRSSQHEQPEENRKQRKIESIKTPIAPQNNDMEDIDATLAALEAEFQQEKLQANNATVSATPTQNAIQNELPDIPKKTEKERLEQEFEFEKHQDQQRTDQLLKKLNLLKAKKPTRADALPTVVRKVQKKVIHPFDDDSSSD